MKPIEHFVLDIDCHLALCKAGLITLEVRRGDSGGKGDLGGVSVGFVSFGSDSSSGFSMIFL